MSQARSLYVAHYGHPLLKGAKHWSFLLYKPGDQHAKAYQLTGSTTTYEVKQPEEVTPAKSSSFMGQVPVGHIAESHVAAFEQMVLGLPITRGNTAWNCQNWIIGALAALKANGFNVTAYGLEDLRKLLAEATPA
ncbi:uncharacterized protein C8Q71DRAFT_534619 [Rhodofomes roseus]|nr:uncharacterized protein C8Q71DRAFT_534619 [Rhodofomes roseus]KAH9838530.1 hypothetical protein C8Q71DRAFT_534619 [Rhodofomes roseus]